jgi:hypothetical protein
MARSRRQGQQLPNTGNEPIPPGATPAAHNRPTNPGGGAPGSGGGTRHATGDAGTGEQTLGLPEDQLEEQDHDAPIPHEERDDLDVEPPAYSGHAGGAVGGTPAEGRSPGGSTHRGIAPGGVHRGDSTIGADPKKDAV